MDLDRHHHHTTPRTSELFICFTSRLSSSSSRMKLSKSILSPSHGRDQPLSLPTSLSRRLKASGSIKGGQSPMFPCTASKKRGTFENPEPSSPKVTCIGQVKMKTKKKVNLSKRRGDLSFRKLEQTSHHDVLNQFQRNSSVHFQSQECVSHRNQRWVHLPLAIYEALREFSCLFPCRSSCFSTNEKEKEDKGIGSREANHRQRSCGDVFARWLVAMQDDDVEKARGVELVVTNGEEKETMEGMQSRMRSSRRHVFEDIEFKDMKEEKAGRVSISIPPKNALLLMRCRSDPMKMADLTHRFWETQENDEDEDRKDIRENEHVVDAQKCEVPMKPIPVAAQVMEMEIESKDEEKLKSDELAPKTEQVLESIVDQATENSQENQVLESEKEVEKHSSTPSYSSFSEINSDIECSEQTEEEKFKSIIKKEIEEILLSQYNAKEAEQIEAKSDEDHPVKPEAIIEYVGQVGYTKEFTKQHKESVLPDCLLLMMCEPKLSMEVSKETWVCSTDFILPQRKQATKVGRKQILEEPKRRRSIDSKPTQLAQIKKNQHLLLPPRSSCSLPAKSMASMIEQKLVNAMAYEPFVLTRCKSEPMRTAAAKLAHGVGF